MSPGTIRVKVILTGSGIIDEKEVPNGTTVGDVVDSLGGWGSDTQVKLNRASTTPQAVLMNGQTVTVAPQNMKAAA